MGPSDRGITAAALHRWDLSPSRLPVNYVSSCLVCSSLGNSGYLALMWLPLPRRICKLKRNMVAVVKLEHNGQGRQAYCCVF